MKHPDINLPKITNAVIKCNKIVIQTMMFMKLFLLDHYDKHNSLPLINDEFINSCMKILCNEKATGRPPKLGKPRFPLRPLPLTTNINLIVVKPTAI